ncbi:putative 5xTM membrane YitT family protein [Kineothrix alysoides]|uniref:Putative 5xTM membrane YitT family protein n=1 Tax=Kineothrix alysoides TaxID=1469948 RepID=A0A4V2QBQ9_9FIRM|nr:YitT family protein [Kineothrix alysoides]TCL57302.1 putative 5xTM membrane YitT family protein [Kineothrix alysoides]
MIKERLIDYILITLSSVLMACAVNFFFAEHTLAPGGITGISIIIAEVTKIPMSYASLAISGPLLILGVVFLGKSFGIKTLYITFATPVFLKIIPEIHVTNSLPAAAIAGGLLVGAGIGLALIRGCATGGTDLMALLLNKIIRFLKLPVILFLLDGTVVILSGIISRDYTVAIFSLVSLFVIIQTINVITSKFGLKQQPASA